MQILGGEIVTNEMTQNAMGGSELMAHRLHQSISKDLLEKFQIILSRVRELDSSKYRILWCHDLAGDPEANHLFNDGWKKFHKIVFVSHYQKQQFMDMYKIPPSKCTVIQNAIEPISKKLDGTGIINFIYHTTPHRGLELLVPIFSKLAEEFKNIHLGVYSSFSVYGWQDRDKPYERLFKLIKEHPQMTYYGGQDNSVIRKALVVSDIFAYPCIWPETSCLALMEAMSAGLICVHPSLAALPETAANCTVMYDFNEDFNTHANIMYKYLHDILSNSHIHMACNTKADMARDYSNTFYDWNSRKVSWETFLKNTLLEPLEALHNEPTFNYSS